MPSVVGIVKDLMELECKKGINPQGFELSWGHITAVVNFAKILADETGADREVVEIAAWLHDIGVVLGLDEDHHIYGSKEAGRLLQGIGYPQYRIEKVKHCILAHRASQSIERETIEAECVACADAMAHYTSIPFLLCAVHVQEKMSVEEAKRWLRDKLDRDWKKISIPWAKDKMKPYRKAANLILQ